MREEYGSILWLTWDIQEDQYNEIYIIFQRIQYYNFLCRGFYGQ